jgi:hypothetical protein
MAINKALRNLQRRLKRCELEHLRQLTVELQERLGRAEAERARAEQCAVFWQEHADFYQAALYDTDHYEHRRLGLTISGQLLVVRDDDLSAEEECMQTPT